MEVIKAENQAQLVDIEKILKSRSPKLYKLLPGFLINNLKRIIHQEEMNDYLEKLKGFEGIDFVEEAFKLFNIKYVIRGIENIPTGTGQRFIFAATHPLGGFDGLMLVYLISKRVGETKAIINDLLLNIKALRPLFVGVNLYSDKTRESVKLVEDAFESDVQMVIFPAGLVSRRKKGIIRDFQWKNTFIKKAIKHRRDIIPVYIEGHLSDFFYWLSNIRMALGIKFNYELIYLPDEMFKQKNRTITLTFGKPISYNLFDKSKSADAWAGNIREHVYHLAQNTDAEFQIF